MHDVVKDASKQASVSKEVDLTAEHWVFGLSAYKTLLSEYGVSGLPCASLHDISPSIKATAAGWPSKLRFSTKAAAYASMSMSTVNKFARYVLQSGRSYKSTFLCYVRGQRCELWRNKARVVLGIDVVELVLWAMLLLNFGLFFTSLVYRAGWPFSIGDSIFYDGPNKMFRILDGVKFNNYLWGSRDMKAFDGSICISILLAIIKIHFSTIDIATLDSELGPFARLR
jgi:hypothetical protein